MERLIPTIKRACVLVTLMFAPGRTGFLTPLAARPARCHPLLALVYFRAMGLPYGPRTA